MYCIRYRQRHYTQFIVVHNVFSNLILYIINVLAWPPALINQQVVLLSSSFPHAIYLSLLYVRNKGYKECQVRIEYGTHRK